MRAFLIILLCIFLYSPLHPEEEIILEPDDIQLDAENDVEGINSISTKKQFLFDKSVIIRKSQIKSSKSKKSDFSFSSSSSKITIFPLIYSFTSILSPL